MQTSVLFRIFLLSAGLFAVTALFSSCSDLDRYRTHQEERQAKATASSLIAFPDRPDAEVRAMPDKTALKYLTDSIDSARTRVYLQVYLLTEKSIMQALERAKSRGLDVRVVLDGRVFGMPKANLYAFDRLKRAKIEVKYSDVRFAFTHSKFFVVDDSAFVSTGNMVHSYFARNREFLYRTRTAEEVSFFSSLFLSDWDGKAVVGAPEFAFLSPIDARKKLLAAFASATGTVSIFEQNVSDPEMLGAFTGMVARGTKLTLVIPDLKSVGSNEKAAKALRKAGARVCESKSPYIHAKAGSLGGGRVFLGSVNLTSNSLDNNREVGVFFRNERIAEMFRTTASLDCKPD